MMKTVFESCFRCRKFKKRKTSCNFSLDLKIAQSENGLEKELRCVSMGFPKRLLSALCCLMGPMIV